MLNQANLRHGAVGKTLNVGVMGSNLTNQTFFLKEMAKSLFFYLFFLLNYHRGNPPVFLTKYSIHDQHSTIEI